MSGWWSYELPQVCCHSTSADFKDLMALGTLALAGGLVLMSESWAASCVTGDYGLQDFLKVFGPPCSLLSLAGDGFTIPVYHWPCSSSSSKYFIISSDKFTRGATG